MTLVNIEHNGIVYPSTENFYQAMKYEKGWTFDDGSPKRKNVREFISKLTPYQAKNYSRNNSMTNFNFEDNKIRIMEYAQRKKYDQEPFKTLLLNTGVVC